MYFSKHYINSFSKIMYCFSSESCNSWGIHNIRNTFKRQITVAISKQNNSYFFFAQPKDFDIDKNNTWNNQRNNSYKSNISLCNDITKGLDIAQCMRHDGFYNGDQSEIGSDAVSCTRWSDILARPNLPVNYLPTLDINIVPGESWDSIDARCRYIRVFK